MSLLRGTTLLLAEIVVLLCTVGNVYASTSSVVLCSRGNKPMPQDEIDAIADVRDSILSLSSQIRYTTCDWSWFNDYNCAYQAAYGVNDSYSMSIYVGHGNIDTFTHYWGWPWEWHPHTQYCIYNDVGGWAGLYDNTIYWNSYNVNPTCKKFMLMWACEQADASGQWITYPCGEIQPQGMCLGWMHRNDLSLDGYLGPDTSNETYIGFLGAAPFLTYDNFGQDSCKRFLQKFYHEALYNGHFTSINQALDMAAQQVWGVDFQNCILYRGYNIPEGSQTSGNIRVLGDGGKHLSNAAGDLCAMKAYTSSQPYYQSFYIPNIGADSFRIVNLFTTPDIEGDQTGGLSNSTSIGHYPDGHVDILDLTFVQSQYGKREGYLSWDYMADVKPDRKIDIVDVCKVTGNYGKSGTYSTDLTDVFVRFDTATVIPDSNGWVSTPQGATCFQIEKAGILVGATVFYHNSQPPPP